MPVVLLLAALTVAQDELEVPALRYDVMANLESFPQGTPKEALTSLVRAVERDRFDYLVAHLIDPEIVDRRVKETKSPFKTVVTDVRKTLSDDPESMKELRRFAGQGEFTENGDIATVTLADVKNRTVTLRKIGRRWFVQNQRSSGMAPAEEK